LTAYDTNFYANFRKSDLNKIFLNHLNKLKSNFYR